jgi:hypothetical protein
LGIARPPRMELRPLFADLQGTQVCLNTPHDICPQHGTGRPHQQFHGDRKRTDQADEITMCSLSLVGYQLRGIPAEQEYNPLVYCDLEEMKPFIASSLVFHGAFSAPVVVPHQPNSELSYSSLPASLLTLFDSFAISLVLSIDRTKLAGNTIQRFGSHKESMRAGGHRVTNAPSEIALVNFCVP